MAFPSVRSNYETNSIKKDCIELVKEFYNQVYSSKYPKLIHPTTLSTTSDGYALPGVKGFGGNFIQTTYTPSEDYFQAYHENELGFTTVESNEIMCAEVKLQNRHLWRKLDELVNEMILVKRGRKLFPELEFKISDLDPTTKYCVLIEMLPIGETRFRFQNNQWQRDRRLQPTYNFNGKLVEHPESPNTGEFWMKQLVCFDKLRLSTYYDERATQNITLSTMQKYQPKIHIVKGIADFPIEGVNFKSFVFPETKFIAVTDYRNPKVIDLKATTNIHNSWLRCNKKINRKRKLARCGVEVEIKADNPHKKTKWEEMYKYIPSSVEANRFFVTKKLEAIDHYLGESKLPSSNLPSSYEDTPHHTLNSYGDKIDSDATWEWPVASNTFPSDSLYSTYMDDGLPTKTLYL